MLLLIAAAKDFIDRTLVLQLVRPTIDKQDLMKLKKKSQEAAYRMSMSQELVPRLPKI